MKIVQIIGGLGNQMFQYAFLIALRETFHQEILMDTNLFHTYPLHNGFELKHIFNITAREAKISEIRKVYHHFFLRSYNISRIYTHFFPRLSTEFVENHNTECDTRALQLDKDYYYIGLFQNPLYFDKYRNVIIKEFSLKGDLDSLNISVKNVIAKEFSISVHVRRGDYLNHANYAGICSLDYYMRALKYVINKYGNNIHFYIFSNDIPWCKYNFNRFSENYQFTYVDWNTSSDSYKDMFLMSSCNINIIANSSFSWWAAYLNDNPQKEIIAPLKWTNANISFKRQLPEWTLL